MADTPETRQHRILLVSPAQAGWPALTLQALRNAGCQVRQVPDSAAAIAAATTAIPDLVLVDARLDQGRAIVPLLQAVELAGIPVLPAGHGTETAGAGADNGLSAQLVARVLALLAPEQQARDSLLLAQQGTGVLLLGADGIVRHANPAAARILRQTQPAGRPFPARIDSDGPFELALHDDGRDTLWLRGEATALRVDGGDGWLLSFQDATACQRELLALRERAARLRTIVDTEPECVKVVAADGTLLDMNPAGLAMLEAESGSDVLGQPVLRLIHPEDRKAFAELHRQTCTGQGGALEFRIVGLKGTERWMETRSTPLREADGRIAAALSITRDISRRKQAEAGMAAAERHSRQILESVNEGIFVLDTQGRITRMNSAGCRMLGWTEAGILGQDAHLLMHHHYPDGRPYPHEDCPIYRTLRDGFTRNVEDDSFFRHDGSSLAVEFTSAPLRDEQGRILGAVVSFHDIEERRQAEQAIRSQASLLTSAQRLARMGSWEMDLTSGRLTWSDSTCELFGIDPADFRGTLEHFESFLLAPDDRQALAAAQARSRYDGDVFEAEYRIRRPDGQVRWMYERGVMERNAEGNVARRLGMVMDITERREAEAARADARQRLVSTLESISDAFMMLDTDWRFTYLNAEAERVLLRLRSDLLGRSMWAEFPKAVGSPFEHEYRRAADERVTVHFEAYYEPLDTWFDVRAHPVSDGLAIYFRDINEKRRQDNILRESEERFRLLANATNDAIWDWNLITDELWWSGGVEALFGHPVDEMEPTIVSWVSRIHPDDHGAVVHAVKAAIAAGEPSWSGEYRFRRKDGEYVFVLDRGYVIHDGAGHPVRMIGGMTDLSVRRRIEEQLRTQAELLEKTQDAILVRGIDDRIRYWNHAAERLYGWPREEALGRDISRLLYRDTTDFRAAVQVVLDNGEWSGEITQYTRSGQRLAIEGRWTLLRDTAGKPEAILAVNTDVTERKRLEQQFLRAQRLESIGTLAGGIAHDLNNVLAPILTSITMLREDEQDPEKLEDLFTIESSARRGAEMVRQLLLFARGAQDGERSPVQVSGIAREVLQMIRDTFPKDITATLGNATKGWPVKANPTQIHQLLTNLCVNARDAMPRGGLLSIAIEEVVLDEVYAGMNLEARPGPYVLLRVEDTGTGMPQDILDRIFEPFFTTKEVGKGTGLGLSTSHSIVQSHGGFIHVYSELGKGTRFKVYLPADVPERVIEETVIEQSQLPRGRGETVLIVDDEESIRKVTGRTLDRYGYKVLTASNGAEAISVYAQHAGIIDLVLTDMSMPVMDGPATIVALKSMNPALRIVGSSGLDANGRVAKAVGAGVNHFVPKPYTAETLLQVIRRVLDE